LFLSETHPAPGCRDAGNYHLNGALWIIGYYGYSWSSSTRETKGIYLHFGTQEFNPNDATPRANGLPLRCLSE